MVSRLCCVFLAICYTCNPGFVDAFALQHVGDPALHADLMEEPVGDSTNRPSRLGLLSVESVLRSREETWQAERGIIEELFDELYQKPSRLGLISVKSPGVQFEGPWKPAEQKIDDAKRNICILGKQVPDFYVLGVQKCATTSLAHSLIAAGMSRVHGDLNPKEFHWFDHRMNHTLTGEDGISDNRRDWLSWMPSCPENQTDKGPKRNALADFTPDYLRLVPRPQQFGAVETDWLEAEQMGVVGPRKMIRLYGNYHARRLQFALMLREPLAQMQSAWYHAASFNFTNACTNCRAPSFRAALDVNLKGMAQNPPQLTPWLWTVLYARQLEVWLEYFKARQFYVIPMGQLYGSEKDQICFDLSKRLKFAAECNSSGAEAVHTWSHPHPSVDDDAGEMRGPFNSFMRNETTRLVKLLANASIAGMGLANYKGKRGDLDAINAWLLSSW